MDRGATPLLTLAILEALGFPKEREERRMPVFGSFPSSVRGPGERASRLLEREPTKNARVATAKTAGANVIPLPARLSEIPWDALR
jgi:hypothetical protein